MTWIELGTLSPEYQWQQFNIPAVGGELFRITQSWNGEYPGFGPAWFSSVYVDSGITGFRKFYSNDEPLLMQMPIPDELEAAGLLVRYIQLKIGIRTRLYENADWQVTLELWTEDTDSGGQPVQRISGGIYVDP